MKNCKISLKAICLLVGRLHLGKPRMHDHIVFVPMLWDAVRSHHSAGIGWHILLCPNHRTSLWHHHWVELYNGGIHVWLWMGQVYQEIHPLVSTQLCLNQTHRWGEQHLLLSRYCGELFRLLCSANAAKIPLYKSHRCPHSKQPGGQTQGSLLGSTPSVLDNPPGHSSPAQLTEMQMMVGLLWPGVSQGLDKDKIIKEDTRST